METGILFLFPPPLCIWHNIGLSPQIKQQQLRPTNPSLVSFLRPNSSSTDRPQTPQSQLGEQPKPQTCGVQQCGLAHRHCTAGARVNKYYWTPQPVQTPSSYRGQGHTVILITVLSVPSWGAESTWGEEKVTVRSFGFTGPEAGRVAAAFPANWFHGLAASCPFESPF